MALCALLEKEVMGNKRKGSEGGELARLGHVREACQVKLTWQKFVISFWKNVGGSGQVGPGAMSI